MSSARTYWSRFVDRITGVSVNLGIGKIDFKPATKKKQEIQSDDTAPRLESLCAGIELVSRDDYTMILVKRLLDENTKSIKIITYTAEVDSGLFDKYHSKGIKNIEIFKRSILSDLAEEQEYNIKRLVQNSSVVKWRKKQKSFSVSKKLSHAATNGLTITQFFYDSPPTRRAYIFDDSEAIAACYEVVENWADTGGSIYKGMTTSPAMYVKNDSPVGSLILEELLQFTEVLRRVSRSWKEESAVLLGLAPWRGNGRTPLVRPRAVLLDMDGVLYDSLEQYTQGWQGAFETVGVIYPKEEVYKEEGRDGKEVIRLYLNKIGYNNITTEVINNIYSEKTKIMDGLAAPNIMSGARELVGAISDSGLDIWVVTGSSRPDTARKISQDFSGLIQKNHVITGKDVAAGKPNPAPYIMACSRAGIFPNNAIVIENAPLGIQSADIAGTFCLAVNTGDVLQDSVLEESGARIVFKSCSHLARLWEEIIVILGDY